MEGSRKVHSHSHGRGYVKSKINSDKDIFVSYSASKLIDASVVSGRIGSVYVMPAELCLVVG